MAGHRIVAAESSALTVPTRARKIRQKWITHTDRGLQKSFQACAIGTPEDPSRNRDDPDSDDEREHRSVDRHMNMEKRAGCGANDQRDKYTAQSAVLFAG